MNRDEMLQALTTSANGTCKMIAQRILSGKSTIEYEKQITGKFMTAVLEGDFESAIHSADLLNYRALKLYYDRQDVERTTVTRQLFYTRGVSLGIISPIPEN